MRRRVRVVRTLTELFVMEVIKSSVQVLAPGSIRPDWLFLASFRCTSLQFTSTHPAAGVHQSARSSKIEDEHDGRGLH
jgi:hypothetical protein